MHPTLVILLSAANPPTFPFLLRRQLKLNHRNHYGLTDCCCNWFFLLLRTRSRLLQYSNLQWVSTVRSFSIYDANTTNQGVFVFTVDLFSFARSRSFFRHPFINTKGNGGKNQPMNRKTGMECQAPLCMDSTCGLQYGSVIRCALHY
jgi:hypothetical protein